MTASTKGSAKAKQKAEARAARNTIHRHALNPEDELMLLRMVGLEPTPAAVKRPADQRPPKKQFEPKPDTEPDFTQLEGRPDFPCTGCGRQMYRNTWPGPWKWGRISVAGHGQCHACRHPRKTKPTQGDKK